MSILNDDVSVEVDVCVSSDFDDKVNNSVFSLVVDVEAKVVVVSVVVVAVVVVAL
jgi:hypothetical protein